MGTAVDRVERDRPRVAEQGSVLPGAGVGGPPASLQDQYPLQGVRGFFASGTTRITRDTPTDEQAVNVTDEKRIFGLFVHGLHAELRTCVVLRGGNEHDQRQGLSEGPEPLRQHGCSRHGKSPARRKRGRSRARLLHFSARPLQWWPLPLRPEPGGRNTTLAQRHPEQSETARASAPRSPRLLQ